MTKTKQQISEAKNQIDLSNVLQKINAHWAGDFEAKIVDDQVHFPNGIVWICDNCTRIHVGFFMDTPAVLIGGMAIALSEYQDRLAFENLPIFLSDDEKFEGDEAFIEYGKSLIDIAAIEDSVFEIDDAQKPLNRKQHAH